MVRPDFPILYEDDDLVVVEKPSGLLSVSAAFEKEETAHALLKVHFYPRKVYIVHRLDQDTSGVMLFALNEVSCEKLKAQFEAHAIERAYTAIVEGHVDKLSGTWESYQFEDKQYKVHETDEAGKGRLAITHFKTLAATKRYSLLQFRLETGRKNQIRVHCAAADHPIAGDKKYGAKTNPLKRLSLHAHLLAFQHPISRKKMHFEAPPPEPFSRLVGQSTSGHPTKPTVQK